MGAAVEKSLTAISQSLDALKEGIVDSLGGLDETLKYIQEMKLTLKVGPGMSGVNAYGYLKREMWRETVAFLEKWGEEAGRDFVIEAGLAKERRERDIKVAAWEARKSKL